MVNAAADALTIVVSETRTPRGESQEIEFFHLNLSIALVLQSLRRTSSRCIELIEFTKVGNIFVRLMFRSWVAYSLASVMVLVLTNYGNQYFESV